MPQLLILTVLQMRAQLLAAGATNAELDEWVAALSDPGQWFPGFAMTNAWARRP